MRRWVGDQGFVLLGQTRAWTVERQRNGEGARNMCSRLPKRALLADGHLESVVAGALKGERVGGRRVWTLQQRDQLLGRLQFELNGE